MHPLTPQDDASEQGSAQCRLIFPAHLFVFEVFLGGKLLCFSSDPPQAQEITFAISLHAQSLCKEGQPSDTAVLPHFCASYS